MREGCGNVAEVLPVGGGGAVLVLSELESMAARQQREIAQQRRLLEQREARLAVLRGAQEPAQQDRLARLRHRLDQQQSKLNRLRLLRSQTDASRANNATLTSDLDCIRALFNEKEKELSLAVAKVEELTRQLEELRGRHHNGTGTAGHLSTPASAELEKLRRELLYRNKMNEQQNQVVSQQRLALAQRQAEMASIDARIAQLQGRLQRKRALNQRLSQQLAAQQQSSSGSPAGVNPTRPDTTGANSSSGNSPKLDFGSASKPRPAGNIAAIEPYSHIPNDNDFNLNKNDPKYQTLPYNTKFTVNFKASDDDVNKNKIQHSASASQIGQRPGNFQQFGHQIAHSQSQSHIQGQSQPLNSNQTQQQQSNQTSNNNNNNINNINNNNNNNTANHNYQTESNQSPAQIRLLAQQQQQQHQSPQQQKQQHGSTSSSTSSLSSSGQNHRGAQTHQKPVSSVAPSFPVKSPIYQTSSTKIHPVMPQTLSLIGRGHPAAQSYASNVNAQNQNGRDVSTAMVSGLQNGQQQQEASFTSRHNYPAPVSQQQPSGSHVPTTATAYQSQNSPNLPQNSTAPSFPGYGYGQTQQQGLDERLKMPEKMSGIEQMRFEQQSLVGKYEAQQVKYEPHIGQPIKLYDQSANKHEQTSKLQQQQQQLEQQHISQGFKQHEPQQFKSEQNQSKFEHLAARYEQQQQLKHDHSAKFEPPGKLPEKPFEYVERKVTGAPTTPGEPNKPEPDKTKPALPPKPSKPNPPPRLTPHHPDGKIDLVGAEIAEQKSNISLPSRADKEEETIPPIPTSEPPDSPTDSQLTPQQQQLHQIIKARPLSLKKSPLSEQPKLRYAKSANVHVSINRRIEMPPAFLFPETEIPADLMQTESQQQQQQTQQQVDVTDSNSLKRLIVSPVVTNEESCNDKLEDSDIVDALNILNIEENKLKSETIEIESSKPAADVIRRKKGNLKSTTGKANLSRRVSFDPLALLLDASLEGELELVKKTAKEVANPSSANDEGITALHNAICAGHLEIVKFLVEFGCDVNAQDSDGWTPLHCAASCNNLAMVRFLVEHGACIFATTLSDHETAAEKCEEDEEGYDGCSEYLYSVQEKLGIMNNGQVFAVFDYDAQHSDELSLKNGDSLVILRKGDDNEREWWWSKLGHREGYVPRNLLGLYPRVQPAKAD